MIIVADSSPLIVLVSIDHADVLATVFGEVVIPPQVHAELSSAGRSEAVRAFVAPPPPWLRVVAPKAVQHIEGLHAGESAAIALAQELQADGLIIDEKLGRKAAVERRIQVVGTVGVLEAAAERGLIDLRNAFEKVKQTDFWISPSFLEERLQLFLARKQQGVDDP